MPDHFFFAGTEMRKIVKGQAALKVSERLCLMVVLHIVDILTRPQFPSPFYSKVPIDQLSQEIPSRDHQPAADSIPAQLLFPVGVQKCCLISIRELPEATTHLSERCAGSDGSQNTFYLSTPGQTDEPPSNRQSLCGWCGPAAHINILSKKLQTLQTDPCCS